MVLPLDPQREFPSYVLLAPGEDQAAGLRVRADLARHVLTVGATDRLGNYRVRAGGTQDGVDLGFSVNLDPQQTRLERLAASTLDEIFGPLAHRLARSREELVREVSAGRTGYDLVPLVVLLWAVCLAGEMILANRFYGDNSNG